MAQRFLGNRRSRWSSTLDWLSTRQKHARSVLDIRYEYCSLRRPGRRLGCFKRAPMLLWLAQSRSRRVAPAHCFVHHHTSNHPTSRRHSGTKLVFSLLHDRACDSHFATQCGKQSSQKHQIPFVPQRGGFYDQNRPICRFIFGRGYLLDVFSVVYLSPPLATKSNITGRKTQYCPFASHST